MVLSLSIKIGKFSVPGPGLISGFSDFNNEKTNQIVIMCVTKLNESIHAVHGVTKSQTRLSDFTFTFHFHALKKETATHSSVLAWRIPGTEEPSGLPSMGSHRVGHD